MYTVHRKLLKILVLEHINFIRNKIFRYMTFFKFINYLKDSRMF